MRPTREQVFSWAREAGMQVAPGNSFADDMYFAVLYRAFSLAYAAGVKAMKERAAKVCEHWEKQNHVYVNGAIRCGKDIRALGDDDD